MKLTRPTWLEIDLEAISQNAKTLMKWTKAREMIAVLKANAYGHGAPEVALKLYEDNQVRRFAVATIDEGIQLRQILPSDTEILLLSVQEASQAPLMLDYQLTPTIDNLDWLKSAETQLFFDRTVKKFSVQIAIDTGMARIGVQNIQQLTELYQYIQHSKNLELTGVYTHFATADEKKSDQYFLKQKEQFIKMVQQAQIPSNYWHLANSPASVWHKDELPMDIIRIGNALYGYNMSDLTDLPDGLILQPSFTWKTRIISVRKLQPGMSVSYGATFTAQQEMWLGTLPIGYADGFRRSFQGGKVLVNGEFQEIIGRISMDQALIALPEKVALGTEVTIIGKEHEHQINLEDWAKKANMIGAEIILGISPRVLRIYKK
ncbi:alanine racemase [Lactococcus termiticola]|uniref:Alanine racemase n=1 Tax=Lactococcus termiticola TaxID=2169526 RepID=A0A2R5HFU2_9LACT|nr:alanine racemase [Lactococcus termiticola]GBG96929.1 alanine racemase [Lactococcus termiticola]